VLFVLRRLVDSLSSRLDLRGLVAESLVLRLKLDSGQKLVCCLRIPRPTRQPDVLFRTLHTYLETLRTESPVISIHLGVLPVHAEQKQLGLFETVLPDPQRFQETLARLVAVLGPDRVGTPTLDNTHRPDAFRLVNPDFENAPVPERKEISGPDYVVPIRRFRPPMRAEVECDSETTPSVGTRKENRSPGPRPVSIRCAEVEGRLSITIGPWRASGNWWEPGGWEREEWDAATSDGRVIRLARQADGWFVEGVVD
jgi:protein ImuB